MKRFFLVVMILSSLISARAQDKMNTIKFNFSPLVFRTFSFQYERVLGPKMSVLLQGGYTLSRSVPSTLMNMLKSMDTLNASGKYTAVTSAQFNGGFQVTPEFRFYPAGNANKGFYIGAYFRYLNLGVSANVDHRDNASSPIMKYQYKGSYSFTSFGAQVGYQWFLGENLTLDWWIVGLNVGSNKVKMEADGDFSTVDKPQYINDINLNLTGTFFHNVNATMNNSKASLQFSMPGLGIRSGLCLGYRF